MYFICAFHKTGVQLQTDILMLLLFVEPENAFVHRVIGAGKALCAQERIPAAMLQPCELPENRLGILLFFGCLPERFQRRTAAQPVPLLRRILREIDGFQNAGAVQLIGCVNRARQIRPVGIFVLQRKDRPWQSHPP